MIDVPPIAAAPAEEPLAEARDARDVRPRLSSRRAIVETLACSSYPTQILAALALGLLGIRGQNVDGSLHVPFVVAMATIDSLLVTALIVWFMRRSRESLRVMCLGERPLGREILSGIGLVPAVILGVSLLIAAVRAVTPSWHNVPANPLTALMADPGTAVLLGFVVVLAGGVREELQRAFQLHRLTPHVTGPATALLVTSLAFGLGHTLQGYDVAVGTGALGAVWGALYLRRRSLMAAAVCHALFNLAQVTMAWFVGQPG